MEYNRTIIYFKEEEIMSAKPIQDFLNLEALSQKLNVKELESLYELPTFSEIQAKLKEKRLKLQDGFFMKHKTKIFFSLSMASLGILTVGIIHQIHNIRYRKLCMEMAKVDHDIAVYVTESANLYRTKPIKLDPENKDIKHRYRLYKQLNKGKSMKKIQQDLQELKSRRVRESHEFNFDLMCLRHQTEEKF